MGVVLGLIDVVVVAFSAVMALAVPLIDAQTLVAGLHPAPLVELKRWYVAEYGDYLVSEKHGFFIGLVWTEIAFLWPLSLANLYGILSRRRWASTTCLLAGASTATSMVEIGTSTVNNVMSALVIRKICQAAILAKSYALKDCRSMKAFFSPLLNIRDPFRILAHISLLFLKAAGSWV